jgi:ADP-ribose pyrophosphatase
MAPAFHTIARQAFPHYPARAAVSDEQTPWAFSWPDYAPTVFTAPFVNGASWADAADPSSVDFSTRMSHCGYSFSPDNPSLPINPMGRTGMSERGYLGKWGPNHAADPIVTRFHPSSGQLQVVCITRKDNGKTALPGGMVDPGEAVSQTVRREFVEEVQNFPTEAERTAANALLDELFQPPEGGTTDSAVIYKGYVDDARNTDHAWLETVAMHFHCSPAAAGSLNLAAGDDAAKAFWNDVSESNPVYAGMFASHKVWVDAAAAKLQK